MKMCTDPAGHRWRNAGGPPAHFHDQRSTLMTCIHCGETGFIIENVAQTSGQAS